MHELQEQIADLTDRAAELDPDNDPLWTYEMITESIRRAEAGNRPMTSEELYRKTAGEIEARDVSNRRELNAAQRRETPPDIDPEAVVVQYAERRSFVPVDARDADYFNNIDQHEDLIVTHAIDANIPDANGYKLTWNEIDNALSKNPLVEKIRDRKVADCPDIGKKVQLTRKGLLHYNDIKNASGKAEYSEHVARSLRVAAAVPALLQNAVEVNRSNKNATLTRPYAHVLMAVYEEAGEYYAVRMVVEHNTDSRTGELLKYDVIGQLHATNTKRMHRPLTLVSRDNTVFPHRSVASAYSVADLIAHVKKEFDDTFAEGVYKRIGMKRRDSDFSQYLQYSDRRHPVPTVRKIVSRMKVDDQMNETEKLLLGKYKADVAEYERLQGRRPQVPVCCMHRPTAKDFQSSIRRMMPHSSPARENPMNSARKWR